MKNAGSFPGSFRVYQLDPGDDGSRISGASVGQDTEPTDLESSDSDSSQSLNENGESAGRVVYEGTLPIAFVSGVPDGTYRYHVEALNSEGELVARSEIPATVLVQHWPVWQAMLLLIIGAVVFLAVVVVIVRGTRS
jgi:hypothetical protein